MLARLQQALTIGLVVLAAAWGAWFASRGQPLLAAAGALLVLFGYALFLGLEFVLLAWQHRADPTPRASARQLLRAWWGEVLTAPQVFCWRQPFRSRAEPDFVDATGRRGMVLVHGFVCNRGIWNPWMAALRQRGVPFIAVDLEPVFGSIDDYAEQIDAAVRRLYGTTGMAPVIVAHSMGGLAVRFWWARHGADAPVAHVVTIGSPHGGTWLARFGATLNGRQMRRACGWLVELEAAERRTRGAAPYDRFTCFYSHCDNIVFPASTATLPGADNRHVPGCAHVHLVYQPAVFSEACRWLLPSSS
jgi:triacylglycerol lipase